MAAKKMDRLYTRWARLVFVLLLIAAAVAFLTTIGDVIELLIVSALIAYLLDPFARWMEARGLTRTMATAVIFVALSAGIGIFLFYFFPFIGGQLTAIRAGINVGNISTLLHRLEYQIISYVSFLGVQELHLFDRVQSAITARLDRMVEYVPGIFTMLGNILAIPFIVFFLLRDGRDLKKAFVNLVPNRYFEFTLNVLSKTDQQLGNYLRGQVIDAFIVGVLSVFVLWFLQVDYFVLIGTLGGIANIVPYVGPVVGGGLAVLVSIFTGGGADKALVIILAFTGIQAIDNTFISPLVVAKTVRLHPLNVLLVVIIGGKFFGVLGMLLAVPAAAIAKVLIVEFMRNIKRYRLT